MQEQRPRHTSTLNRRNINREERSPNVMFTAVTIGAVVLLLAVTFAADWLRAPELNITSASQFLSPNSDNSYDNATINYRLSEEAVVTARVLSEGGGVVRTLAEAQKETAGQHFLTWNGIDDTGRQVADGHYRIEIEAKGAMRSTSTGVALQVDTNPPMLDLLNLQDGSRVGSDLMAVEGITEPGATVWTNGSSAPVAVDGQGHFRTEKKLTEGANRIEVRAADASGNTTIIERTIELVTAPPELVIYSPTEGAWINNAKITVEGQAPNGVTLKINSQPVPLAPDGTFRYDLLMSEGDQRIQVTAVDDVGNVTTVERLVHIQTRGPRLELSIADGASFSDPLLQLSGTTSPGASVTVNRRPVTVGTLGDFQTTVSMVEGENVIEVLAIDLAGNGSILTRRVRYEIPQAPGGLERLTRNLDLLPAVTIPAILLLSILLGMFLYRQNRLEMELSVDTQRFTPGLPEEGKNIVLRLDLNQAARVTIEVLDATGYPQAILLDNRRRSARQHVFLWDGYDDYGRPVTSGIYTVRATAGSPPIKVSSAVQVQVEEDPYVYRRAGQQDKSQVLISAQPQMRRRVRQNRKRI